ncbi:sensor histidine kinase [Nonomuraea jiangxiensis]|uniref:histidine kinase n=1 Tax=Nonomuraea jiangxiensis TaxID=633440 RepID=A0A1G8DPZ5_9ACTN|nr:histidine kinase [Nonomuraea jiangxiensis]SDH59722.1 Signal transduction histidine kinase [Nonomuraea jiangxiensis]
MREGTVVVESVRWGRMAAGMYAVFLAVVAWHTLIESHGVRIEPAAGLALVFAAAVGLCLWRPAVAFWLSLAGAVLASLLTRDALDGVVWPPPVLAIHVSVLVLSSLRARTRVLAERWLFTLLAGLVLGLLVPGGAGLPALAEMTVLSGAALVAVVAVRSRDEAQRRLAQARRESGQARARHALLEERARIARELHDVVAHHMSVVAVQAEAAPYRLSDPPPVLTESFAAIRSSALEALTELHRILGLLRDEGAEEARPALDQLDRLVARMAEAGVPARLEVHGEPVPLAPGVELSAYRIVQEALSNVLRHAPGAPALVEVAYLSDRLRVRVANDAPAGPAAPLRTGRPGHGLIGMRERVAMLEGELEAGPRPDGGYLVHALLPLTREGEA